jgi:ferredoxin
MILILRIFSANLDILNIAITVLRFNMVIPVIDKDLCISCGNCVELCPEVFGWDDEGKADVIKKEGCGENCDCEEAMGSCPTDAIKLE